MMKIFNYKQLLIILKPKYNYPIICKLVIDQLRKNRFKYKQNKLLNNLSKYKVKFRKDDIEWTRFQIFNDKSLYYTMYEEYLFSDNTIYNKYIILYESNNVVSYNSLMDVILTMSVTTCNIKNVKFE